MEDFFFIHKQVSIAMSDGFKAFYSEPQYNCIYLGVEVWLISGAQTD